MADVSCFASITAFFKQSFCDSNRNAVDPFEFEEIMELYIKAGKIDGEVGDCPFAHYVRCVMNYKKLDYNVSHSLIRGVLIQSCSAGAKKFTNYVFCHPQFSGVIQNIENCCAIKAKF